MQENMRENESKRKTKHINTPNACVYDMFHAPNIMCIDVDKKNPMWFNYGRDFICLTYGAVAKNDARIQ